VSAATGIAASPAPRGAGAAVTAAAAELEGVSIFYGEVVGLSQVSMRLGPGVTGIVGPNGSGKTTMMRTLVGMLEPREGAVRVLGGSPFREAGVRARITLVPATENFFPNLSARKNLEVAFLARGRSRAESREMAARGLELVGLTGDADRFYGTWSRGMRQRLKLAVALGDSSPVVLLDEPFLGVDPPNRRALRDHILALAAGGRTVLLASHVLHEIETITDRVGVLAGGRLLGFGRVDRLLQDIRDDHPHRVVLQVDDPRRLAQALIGLEHVRELKLLGDGELELVTVQPDRAYRELPALVVETGVAVRRVETLDHKLEAVFAQVTEAGSRRL
jgi:ABC-2 type transport system ATP-binding protein